MPRALARIPFRSRLKIIAVDKLIRLLECESVGSKLIILASYPQERSGEIHGASLHNSHLVCCHSVLVQSTPTWTSRNPPKGGLICSIHVRCDETLGTLLPSSIGERQPTILRTCAWACVCARACVRVRVRVCVCVCENVKRGFLPHSQKASCVCAYCSLNCMMKPMCVRACLRACVPACLRACVPACLRACVPACLRACVPACLRACVPACLRACARARACVRAWVCVCVVVCVCVSVSEEASSNRQRLLPNSR